MDKRSFLEDAPSFYSVALACAIIEGKREVYTLAQIKDGAPALTPSLVHEALMDAGVKILVANGVVGVVRVAFGPPLYKRLPALSTEWLYAVAGHQLPAFAAFAQVKSYPWLKAALADVNNHYQSLNIQPSDFEEPVPSLWEPLPLDRGDEKMMEAAEAVDEAIATIEADNGYAANVPGERDYVVQSLKTFRTTLRESAQITGMQIKTFALDPLNAVIERFKGAALEVVAGAAKDAIVVWLKAKFGALITWLLF